MRLAVFVAILQCVVNANEIVLSPTLQYFTIAPPQIDMNLAVLVLSARDHVERRNAIRESWADGHSNVFFFVGKHCPYRPEQRKPWVCEPKHSSMKIDPEYNAEQEIITDRLSKEPRVLIVDMIDVYRNIPKKLIQGYLWIHRHTLAKYVLKMDDDSFARVDSVDRWLNQRENTPTYEMIANSFNVGSRPSQFGKWADRKYTGTTYPPWPHGSGHIVSRPTIDYLMKNIGSWISYQGEDVSLGIWIHRVRNNISVVLTPEKQFIPHSGDCHNVEKFVIGHNISPQKMRTCYETMDEFRVYVSNQK